MQALVRQAQTQRHVYHALLVSTRTRPLDLGARLVPLVKHRLQDFPVAALVKLEPIVPRAAAQAAPTVQRVARVQLVRLFAQHALLDSTRTLLRLSFVAAVLLAHTASPIQPNAVCALPDLVRTAPKPTAVCAALANTPAAPQPLCARRAHPEHTVLPMPLNAASVPLDLVQMLLNLLAVLAQLGSTHPLPLHSCAQPALVALTALEVPLNAVSAVLAQVRTPLNLDALCVLLVSTAALLAASFVNHAPSVHTLPQPTPQLACHVPSVPSVARPAYLCALPVPMEHRVSQALAYAPIARLDSIAAIFLNTNAPPAHLPLTLLLQALLSAVVARLVLLPTPQAAVAVHVR